MDTLPRHLRSLPQFLGVAASELGDRSLYGRIALIAKLEAVLRAERARGLARHWSYDLPRHVTLYAIYRLEKEEFRCDFGMSEHPGNPATG